MPLRESKTIVLVDGTSYLSNAYILANNNHMLAYQYFFKIIKVISEKHSTEILSIFFSGKGKSHRYSIFENYKKGFSLHDAYVPNSDFNALLKKYELFSFYIDKTEVQDVIGSLALNNINKKIVISSAEHLIYTQLISDNVSVYNDLTNDGYNNDNLLIKLGVSPDLICDYLSIVGIKHFGIDGVQGVGKKTAAKIISSHGCLENIFEQIQLNNSLDILNFKKIIQRLEIGKTNAFISREIIAICPNQKIPFDLDNLYSNSCSSLIRTINEKSKQVINNVSSKSEDNTNIKPTNDELFTIINNKNIFRNLLSLICENSLIAIEFYNNSFLLDRFISREQNLIGVSLCIDGKLFYVAINHKNSSSEVTISDLSELFISLSRITNLTIVGDDLKLESFICQANNIPVFEGISLNLEIRALQEKDRVSILSKYDYEYQQIETLKKKGKIAAKNPWAVEEDHFGLFAVKRAKCLYNRYVLLESINKNKKLKTSLRTIDQPLSNVLARMEHHGILINKDILNELLQTNKLKQENIINKIYDIAGENFNTSSPLELNKILFHKLKINPIGKKTKYGYSVAKSNLEKFAKDGHEIANLLLQVNSFESIRKSATSILNHLNGKTGRIHTTYLQNASTTRLSSCNPNIQAIPVKTKDGRIIRSAFIAPTGKKIIALDYSQIELRVLAHISGDFKFVNAFKKGLDIHAATASNIYKVSIEDVTDEMRRQAKTINFGLIYGISAFSLGQKLEISYSDSSRYLQNFFSNHTGIKNYSEKTFSQVQSFQYVENIFGRKFYFPNQKGISKNELNRIKRQAVNAPIQSAAADIIKKAMVDVSNWIDANYRGKINMIMQIHDELVFEVDDDLAEFAAIKIKSIMENVVKFNVPLIADCKIALNWSDAH